MLGREGSDSAGAAWFSGMIFARTWWAKPTLLIWQLKTDGQMKDRKRKTEEADKNVRPTRKELSRRYVGTVTAGGEDGAGVVAGCGGF